LETKYKLGPFCEDEAQTDTVYGNLVPTKPSRSSETICNLKGIFGSKNFLNAAHKKERTEETDTRKVHILCKLQIFGGTKINHIILEQSPSILHKEDRVGPVAQSV